MGSLEAKILSPRQLLSSLIHKIDVVRSQEMEVESWNGVLDGLHATESLRAHGIGHNVQVVKGFYS